ncbi:MAG: class I SAM-dependent methyltransferase [Elainellaceae cyanobacterium]
MATTATPLTKLAYQTFQQGKSYFGLFHKALSSQLMQVIAPPTETSTQPISPQLLLQIQQRMNQLLEQDWTDAERGIYSTDVLFDNSWDDFFRYYPAIWVDQPQVWNRVNDKRFEDFSPGITTEDYPKYYARNFHYQTDGYLSEHSANIYDLQVEILFNGTADAMRRRVLAPLKQSLAASSFDDSAKTRILDIACGTGRTLRFLRDAFSKASLYGVDLSPAYLRKANQMLSSLPGELPQLMQANAEALPYVDNFFQGVTSVFMFHELPAPVRQNVIREAYRALQPGGTFIICDSIQLSDSPELKVSMENFSEMFHEPFYRSYIEDDINDRLEQAGFEVLETQIHFMSKYWIARKPAEA